MSHNINFPVGVKKSEFNAQTTFSDTDTLDFVRNSTNFKITYGDFVAGLGVTGSLTQLGPNTAAPILQQSGTQNGIRGLENGSGVKAQLSALNGVKLDHNFIFGQTGVPLSPDSTITSPVIRSLIADSGIALTPTATGVRIAATGAVQATNTVVINEEADFPTQDATTITLDAGMRFVIGAAISTSKRFILEQGAVLTAENLFGDAVTYTGTGAMFTATDASFTIRDITLSSPNASETFALTDSTGLALFIIDSATINSTPKIGTISGYFAMVIQVFSALDADQGWSIDTPNQNILNMVRASMVSTSATFVAVDLNSSVIPNIELMDLVVVAPAGAIGIKGLASNGNVPANFVAKLNDSSFSGGMTQELDGITEDDFRWSFSGNTGIQDTRPDGLVSIINNATETVISATSSDGSNAVKMAGTWTVEKNSHFTADTTGRITYNAERPFTSPIDFAITVIMASGASKNVNAYLAINGTTLEKTKRSINISSTAPGSVNVVWQHEFQTNDYIEVFLENEDDTTNIIGSQGVGRLN